MTQNPTVSFVVPCYKLAHLLTECINSILNQTFGDFEVLIMDDCSPDNTPEVAASFRDPRIRHIRNEPNLGHLNNYNRGIELSRGKYVWLISADDYLKKPYILERYVRLLDDNPRVGYVICPGFGVRDGVEIRLWGNYAARNDHDRIIRGREFLKRLLPSNFVLTAAGLVRRECYQKLGAFPLNMPWAGDWYLWCLFALHYDVGYLAEPMVCYRDHALSMTSKLTRDLLDTCAAEEIGIAWNIMNKIRATGRRRFVRSCVPLIASTYARTTASERYRQSSGFLNFEHFEKSLCENTASERERECIRTHVYAAIGNETYWQGDLASSRDYYVAALKKRPWMGSIWIKLFLLSLGKPGSYLRKAILASR